MKDIHNVVLIDDQPGVLLGLKLVIGSMGFTVHDFQDPRKAVEALGSALNFDLILCDLKMPHLSGLEVLHESNKLSPATPFILMSGHASSTEIQQALNLGAVAFLAKPFLPDELKSTLGALNPNTKAANE